MSAFIKKFLFPVSLCLAVFVLTLTSFNNFASKTKESDYLLKSYKNTVALFKDEELITVYDGIVLNTLPEADIQTFNSGIEVATPAQAEALLEDFDS